MLQYWAEIIKQAAQSPLGVLALSVLVLSSLAYTFFRGATSAVKLVVFALMFAATSAFAASVLRANTEPSTNALQHRSGKWYGFKNSKNKDREAELKANCSSEYERITVPLGNTFNDLCASIGRQCRGVCAWEGTPVSCGAAAYSWGDGSQIGYCE